MERNRFNKGSRVINGLIWLGRMIYPEGEWIAGEPASSQKAEVLFCLANSPNAHYLCIISTEAQINELPNPAHNKSQVRMAKWNGALCTPFLSTILEVRQPNHASIVCHFDECPGHFHRVQMRRSPDSSWFQESIGVYKGRVSVHLLAWHVTEPAQKEWQSTDFMLGPRPCAFSSFYTDPTKQRHVSHFLCFLPMLSVHTSIFLLKRTNPSLSIHGDSKPL